MFTDFHLFHGADTLKQIFGVTLGVISKSTGTFYPTQNLIGSMYQETHKDLLMQPGVTPFFLIWATCRAVERRFTSECHFITDGTKWSRTGKGFILRNGNQIDVISINTKDLREVIYPMTLGQQDLAYIGKFLVKYGGLNA